MRSLSLKYLEFWSKAFPYFSICVFIRIFIIPIYFGSIQKNLNPCYILLGLLNFGAILSYVTTRSLKELSGLVRKYKSIIIIFTLINLANLYSVIFSKYPIFSLLFWGQQFLSYLFIFANIIWFSNPKSKGFIDKYLKILTFIGIYDVLLMGAQTASILYFKEKYLEFPSIIKRILFNGYFLDRIPPQRWDFGTYFIRAPGLLGDTNVNAMFLLILVLILGNILIFTKISQNNSKFYSRALIIIGLGYFFSLSRSALLAFLVILLIFAIKNINLYKRYIKRFIIYSGIFVASALFILFSIPTTRTYILRITTIKQDRSVRLHFFYIKIAIKLNKVNNGMPWGMGTFPKVYKERIDKHVSRGASAHSTYATVFMEQGTFGLVLYVLSFGIIWSVFWKSLPKYTNSISNKLDDLLLFRSILNLAIPFLTISTIFYYGFWDYSTWFWGIVPVKADRKKRT